MSGPIPAAVATVTVAGSGGATAVPDTALLQLGVETHGSTPAEALDGCRLALDQVLAALDAEGVEPARRATGGLERGQEGVVVDLQGAGRGWAAGVGDQDVQGAEAVEGGVDQALGGGRVGDVGGDGQGLAGHGLGGLGQGIPVAGAQHHLGALLAQGLGGGPSQALGGRCDQCHLAFQAQVHRRGLLLLWRSG